VNDNVVVYRSEGERTVDQWIWHGSGWVFVLLAFAAVLVVALAAKILETRDRRRRGYW
jgi:ABC-type multidrug transport system permease subunit